MTVILSEVSLSLIYFFHLELTSWSVLGSVAVSFSLGPLVSVGVALFSLAGFLTLCARCLWPLSFRLVMSSILAFFLYVLPPVADHLGRKIGLLKLFRIAAVVWVPSVTSTASFAAWVHLRVRRH